MTTNSSDLLLGRRHIVYNAYPQCSARKSIYKITLLSPLISWKLAQIWNRFKQITSRIHLPFPKTWHFLAKSFLKWNLYLESASFLLQLRPEINFVDSKSSKSLIKYLTAIIMKPVLFLGLFEQNSLLYIFPYLKSQHFLTRSLIFDDKFFRHVRSSPWSPPYCLRALNAVHGNRFYFLITRIVLNLFEANNIKNQSPLS